MSAVFWENIAVLLLIAFIVLCITVYNMLRVYCEWKYGEDDAPPSEPPTDWKPFYEEKNDGADNEHL